MWSWISNNASAIGRTYPEYDEDRRCYEVVTSHMANLLEEMVDEWGFATVILEYQASGKETCSTNCHIANGINCSCSCLGRDHGKDTDFGSGVYGAWELVNEKVKLGGSLRTVVYRVTATPADIRSAA